jgi:hypothetical protein
MKQRIFILKNSWKTFMFRNNKNLKVDALGGHNLSHECQDHLYRLLYIHFVNEIETVGDYYIQASQSVHLWEYT